MDKFNEEGVPGFSLPGVTGSGVLEEEGSFGTFSGGSGPVATTEGRLGGGGWVNDPMAYSSEHGHGIWAESPAADDEENVASMGADRMGTDVILKTVMGWDESYMASRRFK
jgi:hypothetical protein